MRNRRAQIHHPSCRCAPERSHRFQSQVKAEVIVPLGVGEVMRRSQVRLHDSDVDPEFLEPFPEIRCTVGSPGVPCRFGSAEQGVSVAAVADRPFSSKASLILSGFPA